MVGRRSPVVLIVLASIVVGAYLAEAYLAARGSSDQTMVAAAVRNGVVPDTRSLGDVVLDLRRSGVFAVPFMVPAARIASGSDGLFPVGGIRNAVTVHCNETGMFHPYTSDRYGFNNPDAVWDEPVEVVIVGDSFAHGACTRANESIAGIVAAGIQGTVNLGMSGNGPLIELASFREYGAALRPRLLVWMFFEGNDLGNLVAERQVETLREYLKPDFRQSLADRQDEVDLELWDVADGLVAGPPTRDAEESRLNKLTGVAKLRELRRAVLGRLAYFGGGGPSQAFVTELEDTNLSLLRDALIQAKSDAAQVGSKVLFVYLPSDTYYSPGWATRHVEASRSAVLSSAHARDLPTIDLSPQFRGAPPEAYFYYSGNEMVDMYSVSC